MISIAPLIYWTLGAPFLLWRGGSSLKMSVLLGGAVAGLGSELAFATGRSVSVLATLLIIAGVIWLLFCGHTQEKLRSLREAYLCYVFALIPAVVSPFPILGTWDGDWLVAYQAGQAVWHGAPLAGALLERPPLFGAAVAPLWLIADGLVPYQIFCAVMSSGVLGASLLTLDRFWPHLSWRRFLAPLVLSPFFLHHTAACWAKLMASGFLLAGVVEISRRAFGERIWYSALWFALAVAVHQSSLIYAPFCVAIFVVINGWRPALVLKALLAFSLTTIVAAGLFELWTINRYGLEAKIASNPSVAQRDPSVSFITNTFLVMVTTFVGWSPFAGLARWWHQADPLSGGRASRETFWFVTSWVQLQAGTLVGACLPILLVTGRAMVRLAVKSLMQMRGHGAVRCRTSARGFVLLGVILLVVLLNAMLNPFFSANGTMQTGLTAVGLGGFICFNAWLAGSGNRYWLSTIVIILVIGTIPWVALNLGVSTGLNFSAGFRTSFISGSEGDWQRLVVSNLTPLGLSTFPFLQIALATAIVITALYWSVGLRRHFGICYFKVLHKLKAIVTN